MGYFQKQLPDVFCKKICSEKFRKFHGKPPILNSLFNKVADLQTWTFIKKRLQHRCFLVNIVKFLRASIRSTSANDCFNISEIQTINYVIYVLAEIFIFSFRIYKRFSYLRSFSDFSSTEFVFVFAFFSHTISNFSRNISNVLFSSSLNRLNALSYYQTFVLISNAQNLSSGFT